MTVASHWNKKIKRTYIYISLTLLGGQGKRKAT